MAFFLSMMAIPAGLGLFFWICAKLGDPDGMGPGGGPGG